ncbi:hypothetical protein SAMN02787144_1007210 [Streptomyces atratus]|uniref:Uncharacterized protein n=1 Tax=Streptomyces atratus TaxID=1893 RepID=A0A1K2AQ23_STRAR|nr:hypothetical protein SAMN02787144_1007210 [Streptomyces atratus]
MAGAAFAFWLVMWSATVQTHVPPEALNRLHAYDVAGSLLMLAAGRAPADRSRTGWARPRCCWPER